MAVQLDPQGGCWMQSVRLSVCSIQVAMVLACHRLHWPAGDAATSTAPAKPPALRILTPRQRHDPTNSSCRNCDDASIRPVLGHMSAAPAPEW